MTRVNKSLATKFCRVVPNICIIINVVFSLIYKNVYQFTCTKQMCHMSIYSFRSPVSNLLHLALLVLRIWSSVLDFWKVCGPDD